MPTRIIPDTDNVWQGSDKPPCLDSEHNPPSMIVIPPGHHLEHTCPSCGKVATVYPTVTWL